MTISTLFTLTLTFSTGEEKRKTGGQLVEKSVEKMRKRPDLIN